MRTISFHIQKGGVGKTSLSGNCAAWLAGSGRKTILVDCDPQGSSSSWLLSDFKAELADVLNGKLTVEEALVQASDNLFILPTFGIDGALKAFAETKLFQQPFIFEDLTNELQALGFEFCIFDLSPGMSQLERCVIMACQEVITPLTAEYFSVDGLEIFSAELAAINKNYRRNVQHKKIIANAVNLSFAQHKDRMKYFENLNYELFVVPQDRGIADSQALHKSIFEYNPAGRAALAISQFAEAL